MAYLWKKYEFESEEQADSKISALPHDTDDDGNTTPTHNHTIVKLGYLQETDYKFNNDGEIETEDVESGMYLVDVLWSGLDESPYGWKSKETSVEGNGVHTFVGLSFNT